MLHDEFQRCHWRFPFNVQISFISLSIVLFELSVDVGFESIHNILSLIADVVIILMDAFFFYYHSANARMMSWNFMQILL